MKAHTTIVWFTGASYPDPVGPYETNLTAFLDGGGRLFMSGQDILDQGAGTTDFFHDYVHINWDGTETQNDKATASVTGVTGNPVTNGIGDRPARPQRPRRSVRGPDHARSRRPPPPSRTTPAQTDGLTVASGAYKVVFLAFPFEEFGTAAQKADLMTPRVHLLQRPVGPSRPGHSSAAPRPTDGRERNLRSRPFVCSGVSSAHC